MKNTVWIYKNPYQIEIVDETKDNANKIVVYLHQGEEISSTVSLVGGGVACTLSDKNTLLDGDKLLISCGNKVFCLAIPTLALLWRTQVDMVTCFEIVSYQGDYITHGELEISRLTPQGELLWQFSGKDIFVSPTDRTPSFTLTPQGIDLVDFNYNEYHIGFDGKPLKNL